ncbi:hypothetical protein, partial [Luedemannella flava]|uniref:hypothetical protein n=1 Tax=Luedemannella flava TaxID=349316 RepID=UPI0031D2D5B8
MTGKARLAIGALLAAATAACGSHPGPPGASCGQDARADPDYCRRFLADAASRAPVDDDRRAAVAAV